MTLIVSTASDECVVQVADRRLTYPNGAVFQDMVVKMISVTCRDAVFSIAYTGLAIINGKRIDEILVDYLASINAGVFSFKDIIQSLQTFLTTTFAKIAFLGNKRAITVVLAGFWTVGPFIAWVSNVEDEKGNRLPDIDSNFHIGILYRNKEKLKKLIMTIHGMDPAAEVVTPHLSKIMRHFLHRDPQQIASVLVNIIRRSADHRTVGKYIGKNCLGSVISLDGNITFFDFPEKENPKQSTPHIITPGAQYKNIEVWSEKPPWWKD